MKFKEGDYAKIVDREVTPADVKSCMYYPYFRGLAGTVDKIFDDQICLKVDPDTLPEKILKRHKEVQDSIKRKWLNGLSGEARNRLTTEEKQFSLSYTILVQETDLVKAKPADKPAPAPAKSAKTAPVESAGVAEEAAPAKAEAASKRAEKVATPEDLEAAELAFLKEREQALKEQK